MMNRGQSAARQGDCKIVMMNRGQSAARLCDCKIVMMNRGQSAARQGEFNGMLMACSRNLV